MPHLRFRIEYHTTWGQNLCVLFSRNESPHERFPLQTIDGKYWEGCMDVEPFTSVHYTYLVCNDGNVERELRRDLLSISVLTDDVVLYDNWPLETIPETYLHTAFTQCIFSSSAIASAGLKELPAGYAAVRLHAMPPPKGQRWAIVGSSPELGEWKRPHFLTHTGIYEWSLGIRASALASGVQYKYVLSTDDGNGAVTWEGGSNRQMGNFPIRSTERLIVNDFIPNINLSPWRGAGVVIPVFSLRSAGSQGIGDFGDLKTFIRWAASVDFSTVQILPVNDTTSSGTWRDSYPYNGISVFALHPIYLDLRQWEDTAVFKAYTDVSAQLNALKALDYEATYAMKIHFAAELYRLSAGTVTNQTAYIQFVTDNAHWLMAYAHFMTDKAKTVAAFQGVNADPGFFFFLQYLLHEQLLAAHDLARESRVILKGDIPIGVCPDSVPVEADRHLFHLDGRAGAPPDAFAVHGQNWGFPTYNWEEMAKDGYAWWRRRLAHMGQYFDAYRIDHVLGFFRIWEIPATQVYGLLGHFRPALPLSTDEIRHFGFLADIDRYTRPFITARRMEELASECPQTSWAEYFERDKATGDYLLKPHVAAQTDIQKLTADEVSKRMLMDVACEVLFIPDPDGTGWHPRIGAQQTDVFKTTLSGTDREAFTRLHDAFFYSRHNDFWARQAMKKLPVIIEYASNKRGSMLPCAEDLGMVPTSVKGVLEGLHILSLEIQRMPKTFGMEFGNPADNPYLSVATIDTHDMPPIRLWWHEDRRRTQRFWNNALHHTGMAPQSATPDVCKQIIAEHLASPSMLCLIGLQDYLAIDTSISDPDYRHEQINVPANPDQYWNYRMPLTLERLFAATGFNERLRSMIASSGRS